jgi:chaperonin cofactor prefoldin
MMTSSGDKILVLLGGETFFEQSEDAATEYCEELVETSQEQLSHCQDELQTLQKEQQVLKQELNARFGKSINLEE